MAKGLLAAGFNIGNVDPREFNDWYNTEHLPERKNCNGFINAVRWESVDDPKVAIATYDLDNHGVLHDAPYKAIARENLSPWSKSITARLTRLLRIEGEQLIPSDQVMTGATQHLMIFACNVKPDAAAEVRKWYAEEHIPNLSKVPGVASARFYASHAGTHNHVALYEIDKPETCASDAWKKAVQTEWTSRMRPHLNDVLRVTLKRYVRGA